MQDKSQKRSLQQLYRPPPPEDYSKNYLRLGLVIAIATIFIGVEVVGGTIAKSIAIISDAIHLVSDLLGFVFSFLFLYLSKKEMDQKVSFGYHRMELIGALANIFIVWTMVLFIMVEATQRIINKEFVERPAIMLITAIAGMLINIILYKILHGGSSHSHGLMSGDHDHDHSHSESSSQQCSEECRDEYCNKTVNEAHCHKGSDRNVHRHTSTGEGYNHPPAVRSLEEKLNPAEECKQKHVHTNTCYLKKHSSPQTKHKHVCDGHHHEGHGHNHEGHKHDHKDHDHSEHNHEGHSHDGHNHQGHKHEEEHNHEGHQHDHEGHHDHDDHDHDDHDHHSHESIGMKASVLHALSDLVQSVGVVISAVIIYFFGSVQGGEVTEWNPYHLFDPIATYIFSILSLIATVPVIKNCYYLIMESTPAHIDLDGLREEFQHIEGVIDVHDIHVWDLKPGKTIIIAHVLSKLGAERAVLKSLTELCRHKKIYHSTFQVEEQDQKDAEDYIRCHHDIH